MGIIVLPNLTIFVYHCPQMSISIFDYDDYRNFLRDSLEEKARRNPAFSLRAFARDTGLSPSHLSRALSGQKKLSSSSARLVSEGLGLGVRESEHMQTLIELEKAARNQYDNRLLKNLTRHNRRRAKILALETFQAIANWYHFAILALTNTRGFQSNPGWIARRLGIKPLDASFAIDRLLELKLLTQENGNYVAADGAQVSTTDDFRSAAIQENHRQHLEIAAQALKDIDVELREFNNITLAMNLSDIPKAKQKIREFVDRFNREMDRDQGQELFQMNVQFYQVSQQEKGQS